MAALLSFAALGQVCVSWPIRGEPILVETQNNYEPEEKKKKKGALFSIHFVLHSLLQGLRVGLQLLQKQMVTYTPLRLNAPCVDTKD